MNEKTMAARLKKALKDRYGFYLGTGAAQDILASVLGASDEEPLTWTTDLPTESGWYWIQHPDDGGQATMRHLSRYHGEWHFDGRLSSEIPPRGFDARVKRMDTLWMQQAGCRFYGPLRVPKS